MRTFLRAALATAAYAAVHSLLAAARTKEATARRLGPRHRAGLYRPFYIAQSLATFGVLAAYLRSLPRQPLYRVEGAPALLMRAGQAGSIAWATLAAKSVGLLDLTGLRNLGVWLTGGDPGPEPEAQGPAPDPAGGMRATGPFRYSRHPLNLAPLPILWLRPELTTRVLGFNVVATVYLVLGSVHEERRLTARYGDRYRRYLESGVPFYAPGVRSSWSANSTSPDSLTSTATKAESERKATGMPGASQDPR